MEVKVQIQMIRGPGRQYSWMTEKERKKGRNEDKVDTWTIGSPGIYDRLWKLFEKIQEQWNAEILLSPAVLVKEELPKKLWWLMEEIRFNTVKGKINFQ